MKQKIRIIGRWSDYRIGEILSPPGSLRTFLLNLKVAELVNDQQPEVPTVPAIVKRGRGRPRKNPL